MRSVALDVHKDLFVLCEVSEGKVVFRKRSKTLDGLIDVIGPGTPPAKIAFEACRSAWHVYDTLTAWGQLPPPAGFASTVCGRSWSSTTTTASTGCRSGACARRRPSEGGGRWAGLG